MQCYGITLINFLQDSNIKRTGAARRIFQGFSVLECSTSKGPQPAAAFVLPFREVNRKKI